MGSLTYERHEGNIDTFRDGLLEPIGYNYEFDGLANIRDGDGGVL